MPTRLAPPPRGKKKPPMMDLSKSRGGAPQPVSASTEQPGEDASIVLTIGAAGSSSAPATGTPASRPNYQSTLQQQLADLDINGTKGEGNVKIELKSEDLKELSDLGHGNGGSVKKVVHLPTGKKMAKKIVLIDAKPAVRKQILRELQFMHNCHSSYIVSFYGAFIADPNICICMEFMDKGSLDNIYKRTGPIPMDIVARVAHAVLEGLIYLYDVHRIIHRDIKPSNMLLNSEGQIVICDFGVSGELINSIADTFVGTSTYMSPERIQGAQYTVKSDVWSVGISLIELALGRFPFSDSDDTDEDEDRDGTLAPGRPLSITTKKDRRKSKGVSLQGGGMTMSILELLQHIVNEPAPRLTPEDRFAEESIDFTDKCLLKDPHARLAPKALLQHVWIQKTTAAGIDVKAWAQTV